MLVNYLHRSLFSPSKISLPKYIEKVHLVTWPVLTEYVINRYLKMTPGTALGHMNKKGITSATPDLKKKDLEYKEVTPAGTG